MPGSFPNHLPETAELLVAVQLAPLFQTAAPGIDQCHRVRGNDFSLKIAVIMAADRAVRCFVLIFSIRRYQHRRHHGVRPVCGCKHVAHDVAVIILCSPDITAGGFDGAGYGIVNQTVFIVNTGSGKAVDKLIQINPLENIPKMPVVYF